MPVVLLEFLFDQVLKELIKTIPGAAWQPKLKAWPLPYLDEVTSNLLSLVKGKAWLDYLEFKKVKLTDLEKVALPAMDAGIAKEIEKFSDWMRNRRYPESTIRNYVHSLGLLLRFTGNNNPEDITNADLENFHRDYILKNNYSASFQSLVINAEKLYFSNRLKRNLEPIEIERPKNPRLFPHVLSKEEVKAILLAHQNIKHRAMLSLIYACGLRSSVLLNLKPKDIDANRGMLRINQGKGKKDQMVPSARK